MIFIAVLAFAGLAMALATPATSRSVAARRADARGLLDGVLGPIFGDPDTDDYLLAHNKVRILHEAPSLQWNTTLAEKAAGWANGCQVRHSDGTLLDGTPYGENLVAAAGNFPIADAISQFTSDTKDYDPANPTLNHFTQVVWKATTQLGCSLAHCGGVFDPSLGQASYYVCLYYPPGNVIGQAAANVHV
ncbi:CAP domain-containing protein [Mycena rosella]|uniref:CAP domain-containing protein n=1 Tax=Mycena rosella TaxID=1033263 RepID=A0AAD7BV67_MYCRO|nr:CAP domain-containing protein [Mycena rosella]